VNGGLAPSRPAQAAGAEHTGSLAGHEARSAARRLVFQLTEAWDAGDEQAFGRCFTPQATVSGLGHRPGAPADAFRAHLAATAWSLHWLGNEQASAWPGHAGGSWLWWSFEQLSDGRAAYAGGDLGLVFERAGRGYLISDLEITERYRVPVTVGWLNDERPGPAVWATAPLTAGRARSPLPVPLPAGPGPDARQRDRLEALTAERALRQLMAGFVRGLEERAPAAELARLWSADGRYVTAAGTAAGQAQLTAQLAAELAGEQPVMRLLGNGGATAVISPAAGADQASAGRWRELRVATAGGQARWQAHLYDAEAVRERGAWRLRSVRCERILDVPYGAGWAQTS
jgi:SnoaL-like domain